MANDDIRIPGIPDEDIEKIVDEVMEYIFGKNLIPRLPGLRTIIKEVVIIILSVLAKRGIIPTSTK